MPKDFKNTVQCLRKHLTDDEVSNILQSQDHDTGNLRIITSLIFHLRHGEGLFEICDILESVKDSPHLSAVIKSFRKCEFIL